MANLKIAITSISQSSPTNPFGLGPLRAIYVSVTNVGAEPSPLFLPQGAGSVGATQVSFTASSVGAMVSSLAPKATHAFVLQNASHDGQNAIYNGEINVTTGEAGGASAFANKMAITNPH